MPVHGEGGTCARTPRSRCGVGVPERPAPRRCYATRAVVDLGDGKASWPSAACRPASPTSTAAGRRRGGGELGDRADLGDEGFDLRRGVVDSRSATVVAGPAIRPAASRRGCAARRLRQRVAACRLHRQLAPSSRTVDPDELPAPGHPPVHRLAGQPGAPAPPMILVDVVETDPSEERGGVRSSVVE